MESRRCLLWMFFNSLCLITFVVGFRSTPRHLLPAGRTVKVAATATTTSAESAAATANALLDNFDHHKEDKLPWIPSGYKTWKWQGNNINYVDLGGKDDHRPPLLLIHGFGASIYHWRYNLPALARKYHVYAIDLLGFGLSDKPIMDYDASVWRDQALDFIEEVIMARDPTRRIPCVIAGNSLGGYAALAAAGSERASRDKLINGCILLNAAGKYRSMVPRDKDGNELPKKETNAFISSLQNRFKRFLISLSFVYTKQPARIGQVLRQVYPVDNSNVDDELITSIQFPSQHPNAAEVFYRVIERNGNGPAVFVEDLLAALKTANNNDNNDNNNSNNNPFPLLLLWGMKDPWILPHYADKIQKEYPAALRVEVDAGHCPHDEAPEAVNRAILEFMDSLHDPASVNYSTIPAAAAAVGVNMMQ